MTYIVYKHTNKLNGKSYIGITKTTMELRWKRHIYLSKKNSSSHIAFGCAIQKHGTGDEIWDHIVISTVETLEEAFAMEKRCIQEHKTMVPDGYNMTTGGEGRFGPLSESAKESLRNVVNDPEHRRKNSEAQKKHWKENPHRREERSIISKKIMSSEDMRKLISQKTKESMESFEVRKKLLDHASDPENRKKKRENAKRSWDDPEVRKKHHDAEYRLLLTGEKGNKKVHQIDKESGEILMTYMSICQASRETKVPKSSLLACLRGVLKHAGGFLWKLDEQ